MDGKGKRPQATALCDLHPETQLWFLLIASFDMRQAHEAIQRRHYLRSLGSKYGLESSALLEMAIIRYMRPFLLCETPSKRKKTKIPDAALDLYDEDERSLHLIIRDMRSGSIAHSDMGASTVTLIAEFERQEPFEGSLFHVGAEVAKPAPTESQVIVLEGMIVRIADYLFDRVNSMYDTMDPFRPLLVGLGVNPPIQPHPDD